MSKSFQKINRILKDMQSLPRQKGREVHRRTYLIEFFRELGFPEPLNDVSQTGKVPDLRFYSENIESPSNSMPSPYLVETKDIGTIRDFKSLPFTQICKYIKTNKHRLVAVSVTDYKRIYHFDFSVGGQPYFDLVNIAQHSNDAKEWEHVEGEKIAQELLRLFWVSPAIDFFDFLSENKVLQKRARQILNPSLLEMAPPKVDVSAPEENLAADVESVAETLSTLLNPIISQAIQFIFESQSRSKIRNRFTLWINQKGCISDVANFLAKDRSPEEEDLYVELIEEFAWLSTYSLVNLLYFIKGLEERSLIPSIFEKNEIQNEPGRFFEHLWRWIDSYEANFATDFIRLQKVYCDWLISKVSRQYMNEVVIYFSRLSLLAIGRSDLLGRLYEMLMQKLDPKSRRKLGQYYTPRIISEALWKICQEIIEKKKIPNEEVVVLDPGCGSGMLLCRGVEVMLKNIKVSENSIGLAIREFSSRNINGFEINPLSAAIARINLYYTYLDELIERGIDPRSSFLNKVSVTEIPVFNTDAYRIAEVVNEDLVRYAEFEGGDIEALHRESVFLTRTKSRSDFILIVGNPPYCGSDASVLEGRASHLQVWSAQKARRKPNSGIREALLHYMGLAHSILSRRGEGTIAYVTSDSWLNNHDHEVVRRFFFRQYDPFAIVFMGPNMFPDVKVSTALVLLNYRKELRDESEIEGMEVKVASLNIEKDPEKRYIQLEQFVSNVKDLNWQVSKLDKYACISYKTESDVNFDLIDSIGINEIFIKSFPACETGADPFLTSSDESILRKRMKKILASDDLVDPDQEISGKNTKTKLVKIRKIRDKLNICYKTQAVKRYIKFMGSKNRFSVIDDQKHYLYFEPCLLHRSIMQGDWNPHEEDLRIAFNVHEIPLRAFVVPREGYLHRWQHMRFAPMKIPAKVSSSKSENRKIANLTENGKKLREKFESDEEFMHFIAGWINSDLIQVGFKNKAKTIAPLIPFLSEGKSYSNTARNISRVSGCLSILESFKDKWQLSRSENAMIYRHLDDITKELDISKGKTFSGAYDELMLQLNSLCDSLYEICINEKKAG